MTDIGYDGCLVHEASRVSLQVCERFHDRNGVLGWSRAEESPVSRAESKFDTIRVIRRD